MPKILSILFCSLVFATCTYGGEVVVLAAESADDYDTVIVKEVLKRAGYTVDIREAPWARCLKMIEVGEADILGNVFATPERKKVMLYGSVPLFIFKQFLYVKKDANIEFDGDLSRLKRFTIGTRIGFSYGDVFDAAIRNGEINVEEVSGAIQNIRKLDFGRIHMFVENPMNMIMYLEEQNKLDILNDLKLLRPSISKQPTYIVVSKQSRLANQLIVDTDLVLTEMRKDGSFRSILKERLGNHEID